MCCLRGKGLSCVQTMKRTPSRRPVRLVAPIHADDLVAVRGGDGAPVSYEKVPANVEIPN